MLDFPSRKAKETEPFFPYLTISTPTPEMQLDPIKSPEMNGLLFHCDVMPKPRWPPSPMNMK
jgi:hypothetical protein